MYVQNTPRRCRPFDLENPETCWLGSGLRVPPAICSQAGLLSCCDKPRISQSIRSNLKRICAGGLLVCMNMKYVWKRNCMMRTLVLYYTIVYYYCCTKFFLLVMCSFLFVCSCFYPSHSSISSFIFTSCFSTNVELKSGVNIAVL